jgi:hypothetical protein
MKCQTLLLTEFVNVLTNMFQLCFELLFVTEQCHFLFSTPHFAAELVLQCVWKVAVLVGYGMWIWLSVSKLPLKCAVVV